MLLLQDSVTIPLPDPSAMPDQMEYGLILYVAMCLIGLSMLGKPHWGFLMALVGVIPWLVVKYPLTAGAVIPLTILYVSHRWGIRHVLAMIGVSLLFISMVLGRIQAGGYDFGFAFVDSVGRVAWAIILLSIGLFLYRLITRRNRGQYLMGDGLSWHGERVRMQQTAAYKRGKSAVRQRLEQPWQAIRRGHNYQGKHRPGPYTRGSAGDQTAQGMEDAIRKDREYREAYEKHQELFKPAKKGSPRPEAQSKPKVVRPGDCEGCGSRLGWHPSTCGTCRAYEEAQDARRAPSMRRRRSVP